jgi:2-C-methyl-D-erythritol 4-phosphate cytidylyltransferase
MERVGVIVPAAGRSERMTGVDKLFLPLGSRPLLAWCLDTLEKSPVVARIIVSVSPERISDAEAMSRERKWMKTAFVRGGARRQDSVASALDALGAVDWVLVHDGDRPFLTEALIAQGLHAARETGVAVACTPVTDTVKVVDAEGLVVTTLERDTLRAVQTPQVFRADIIRRAYSDIEETVTDDARLAERLLYAVRLYPGSHDNVKVTTPDDLLVAQAIAGRWEARP